MNTETNGSRQRWYQKLIAVFSIKPKSREELEEMLETAHEENILDNEALDIIKGALQVSKQQVREVMVPRTQMVVIQADTALDDILSIVVESKHSRFPVVGESLDDIRGILLAKDLLPLMLGSREQFELTKTLRAATTIPESKRLNILLREFREQRYHMAMVVDEYGSVSGLVTIEDLLEEIVGEIEDETDMEENQHIRTNDNNHFVIAALTPIDEFNEHFSTNLSEEEFDTVGGLVAHAFGHFPTVGEIIEVEDFIFTILQADERQIHQLDMTTNTSKRGTSDVHVSDKP